MDPEQSKPSTHPTAGEDAELARSSRVDNPSYRLAYADENFIVREELRAVRLQLEWLKADLVLQEQRNESTVVVFGGARFREPAQAERGLEEAPTDFDDGNNSGARRLAQTIAESLRNNARYYDEARALARKITELSRQHGDREFVVVTGGGPGVMEAANRGAADAGGKSIGLNILLPFEQAPDPHITPDLCFQFHYFAIRKVHFLNRAKGFAAFPGGFGPLDELLETLTLIQTQKIRPLPVVLIGKAYRDRLIEFDFLVEQGAIAPRDLALFRKVETADEAFDYLSRQWKKNDLNTAAAMPFRGSPRAAASCSHATIARSRIPT